ncbi:Alpha/Beta hydrolase protein [Mycena olivaceomarginata]|nr:Alpha/Beta hydrolase protein [Mycena olivaceomarginata]
MFPISFVLFTAFTAVLGAPSKFSRPQRRLAPAALTALTVDDLNALDSFTQFARVRSFRPVDKLMAWDCGEACDANPNFQATLAGGMGNAVQFFFVGYYPKSNSVIVSHQGTDPIKLMSDLTDLNVFKGELNSTLFPNAPAGLEIHSGFRDEHAITADEIRTEVQRLISDKGATQVTVVGHSLGVPKEIGVNAVTYGTPRVGTPDFVSFFDSQVTDFKRVNNENVQSLAYISIDRRTLVPIVPGRFLGFAHPQGEIHIVDGDTKEIEKCQIKTVPSILSGNIIHHLGPYNGIFIGSVFCT